MGLEMKNGNDKFRKIECSGSAAGGEQPLKDTPGMPGAGMSGIGPQ